MEDTSYYKALVQAERLAAIGQTIASLSHHIKNILQGVRGGSYLIELGLGDHDRATREDDDGTSPEKAVETIRKGWNIVERNQDRISKLVMDMLTFSKEREPEPVPTELNEVLAEVHQLMTNRAEENQTTLVWEPDESLPALLLGPRVNPQGRPQPGHQRHRRLRGQRRWQSHPAVQVRRALAGRS